MKDTNAHVVRGISMWLFALILVASCLLHGQDNNPAPQASSPSQTPAPVTTLKVTTRMVTLQVVARNSKGAPVTGLTANDFQIFEQVPPKKDRRQQNIAAFQEITIAAIAAADTGALQLPRGVYSNLVTMQKAPVPPTILLIDGLNSDVGAQMQVHRQMIKLLASIPLDIPVAVFLLDRNLHLLQNFTTDRTLLRAAVQKTLTTGSPEVHPADARDDSNVSVLAQMILDVPTPPSSAQALSLQQSQSAIAEQVMRLQQFERESFSTLMSIRVRTTIDAFRAIARHVAGYPGRKNLLWISSSFPLAIFPDPELKFAGMDEFQDRFAALANTLSDAKIAVYPMDPAGLESQTFFDVSAHPARRAAAGGTAAGATIMREEATRSLSQLAMSELAQETGGRVCVNNNDLSDCVKKAVDDGSSYYELAYYPDAGSWTGEYHRVSVKTSRPGVELAFRQGYYARSLSAAGLEKDTRSGQDELQEAVCHDLLTSTSILLMTESIPPDKAGDAKYFIAIDPTRLSFDSVAGSRKLSIIIAGCTFDKNGTPLQFVQQPSELSLTDQQYRTVVAQHGFVRALDFTPNPATTRVRLLVRDNTSGRMGSVELPFPAAAVANTTPDAPSSMERPPQN